jgi:uncharacterized membrane protein YccC
MKKTLGGLLNRFYSIYAIRATVFAALSSIAAYSTANLVPELISPTIAAIIALSAIKTNVNDTVKETFKQVGGSFFGALLGIFLVNYIGFNVYSILITVVVSMILGFIIRLQVQGGLAIAATVILVSGPLFGDFQSIEQRVAGVLVGSLFAFFASLFMSPWKPDKKILRRVVEAGYESTQLLSQIGRAYKKNSISLPAIKEWQNSIESIYLKANQNNIEAKQLLADARWTPFVTATTAENIQQQARLVKVTVAAIRTIIFAIENSLAHEVAVSENTNRRIASLINLLASSIDSQLINAEHNPAGKLSEDVAQEIRERRRKLANEISKMDDTRAIMLGGTILHEATKIKDLISGEN